MVHRGHSFSHSLHHGCRWETLCICPSCGLEVETQIHLTARIENSTKASLRISRAEQARYGSGGPLRGRRRGSAAGGAAFGGRRGTALQAHQPTVGFHAHGGAT